MAQQLDPNCGEFFQVWNDYVYFQAGKKGLYRVPCNGKTEAQPLDENCGNLVVPGDGYVYFQAGNKGLYRVQYEGKAKAQPLDENCGENLAVWNGYVYFQAGEKGLYRVPCDGSAKAQPLDDHAGYLVVPGDGYVYFQAGGKGLYRVPCDGSAPAHQLDDHAGYLVVPGDGYVYFQAGGKGLYRVPCDGSAPAHQLDDHAGHLVVPGDGYVYFQAGSKGLYRVPCDGSAKAKQLDDHCDHLVVFGDGYVYFQAGDKGLYRVPCDGSLPANRLDKNCGNLIASSGYIYFQGGPGQDSLYRLGAAVPSAPSGLKMRIQDEYVVDSILPDDINHKFDVITALLNEASGDASDTWFINFTSGASSGAYPDAVAGKINGPVATSLKSRSANKQNRLGTIVMDFPDDNGNTDLINLVFNYNSPSSLVPKDWMRAISGDKKLSELTIPGTHDSCTFNASPMSKCQNLNLEQQLEAGIRYIDIRCCQLKDRFELYHGVEYLGLNFDYVLGTCKSFLKAHSQECIIMSIKEENDAAGNTKTFEEVFEWYMEPDKGLWSLGNNIPKLSQVRGRIVLLRRFYIAPDSDATKWGIDLTAWPENTTFSWPF